MDFRSDKWLTVKGKLDGQRADIRKNVSLRDVVKTDFPHVLVVSLFYESIDRFGLPDDKDEKVVLEETERNIALALHEEKAALFALIVTSDGARDLFFYFSEACDQTEIDGIIRDLEPELEFDFEMEKDPQWTPYKQLVREN